MMVRGLGDCGFVTDDNGNLVPDPNCTPPTPTPPPLDSGSGGGGSSGGSLPMGGGSSPSWTPAQLAQLLGVAGTAAGNAIMASQAPPGYVFNTHTGQYQLAVGGVPGMGSGLATTTVGIGGSVIPLIVGAVVVLGIVMALKK